MEYAPPNVTVTGIYHNAKDIVWLAKKNKWNHAALHQCDLLNFEQTKKLFQKNEQLRTPIDACIFLAANVNVPLSKSHPDIDLDANVKTLLNFLMSCPPIKRFIYLSTAGVYDGNHGEVTINTKLNPTTPYCISKLAAEQYVKFFQKTGKIKEYVIIRFGGAYGKYAPPSKFIDKLVREIYLQNKNSIEIYGDGTNLINVMYAKDVVCALIGCLRSKKSNITCNLAQENMTVTEAVTRIASVFGKKITIKYTPQKSEQKYINFTYESDFDTLFDFKPEYSFEHGIREYGKLIKDEKQ